MKFYVPILAFILVVISQSVCAKENSPSFSNRRAVKSFINEMHHKHGFNKTELTLWFSKFRTDQKVLSLMSKQYEALPWYEYRKRMLTQTRIQNGILFWKKNNLTLKKIQKKWGIPPQIVIAILGIETRYGEDLGRYPVLQTLSTLAFDYPRRAAFFKKELEEFLLLSKEGAFDPIHAKGSFAGAMGMPQFMPSSYRRFAIDFSEKGKRDILENTEDVLGSVANYLAKNGWKPNEKIILDPQDIKTKKTLKNFQENKDLSLYELSQYDLKKISKELRIKKQKRVKIIALQDSKLSKKHSIGLNNFYTIMRYNNSVHYAMAVYELSEKIKSGYRRNIKR